MNLIFQNGTVRQQDWFIEAMAHAIFPWDRSTAIVWVKWVPHSDLPNHHNDFAITMFRPDPLDPCGRPNSADIWIVNDLDDPNRPGNEGGTPRGWFAGKEFYMESVIHELGHVMQMKFTAEQKLRMTIGVYQGTRASDWDSAALKWEERREECDAETFKDVWLPKQYRKFNNRAKHKIPQSAFERYLSVFDEICPCTSTGACFEEQVVYHQRSGGDIGFTTLWFDPQDVNDDVSALGPSHPSTPTFPPVLPFESITVRIRWGGIGYEVGRQDFDMPNPYYDPRRPPTDTFSFEFFDLASGGTGWRLVGTNGTPTPESARWYWDPNAPSLIPHQAGRWIVVNNFDPVTEDNVTGSGFVPEWYLASLKLCGPLVIS